MLYVNGWMVILLLYVNNIYFHEIYQNINKLPPASITFSHVGLYKQVFDPPPFLQGILNWFLITEIKGKHLFGIIVYETSFLFVKGDCGNGFLHFLRTESMVVLGDVCFNILCL